MKAVHIHDAQSDQLLTLRVTTCSSSFDDLREDVFGDVVAVLHGGLSVVDPLGSGCAQQAARFPHFFYERPVLRVELGLQNDDVTLPWIKILLLTHLVEQNSRNT